MNLKSPQVWLVISSALGTFGYGILYAAYWLPFKYFIYCQYIFGILGGIGSGFSFGLICITPQHWLDKERSIFSDILLFDLKNDFLSFGLLATKSHVS